MFHKFYILYHLLFACTHLVDIHITTMASNTIKNTTHLLSLNCNGLGDKSKRARLLQWLNYQRCDILFIQETHFTPAITMSLENEFIEWKLLHSFGDSNARGCSILINKKITIYFNRYFHPRKRTIYTCKCWNWTKTYNMSHKYYMHRMIKNKKHILCTIKQRSTRNISRRQNYWRWL